MTAEECPTWSFKEGPWTDENGDNRFSVLTFRLINSFGGDIRAEDGLEQLFDIGFSHEELRKFAFWILDHTQGEPYDKGEPKHRPTELALNVLCIPHSEQRYPTAGDWYTYMGNTTIRVSEMSDPRYEQLVALHEVVEFLLCKWTGVTQEEVDEWDKRFIAYHGDQHEPGDDHLAPYNPQHTIASIVERLAAPLLNVDWNDYLKALEELE